jgi:peptide/nickel transport system substrate-binding protein
MRRAGAMVGWTGRPDVDGNLRDLLYSGAPTNYGGWKNPAFDALLDQARTTSDMTQRMPIYTKVFQTLREEKPIIYLYSARWNFGATAKLEGFVPVPDGMLRLNGVKLAK